MQDILFVKVKSSKGSQCCVLILSLGLLSALVLTVKLFCFDDFHLRRTTGRCHIPNDIILQNVELIKHSEVSDLWLEEIQLIYSVKFLCESKHVDPDLGPFESNRELETAIETFFIGDVNKEINTRDYMRLSSKDFLQVSFQRYKAIVIEEYEKKQRRHNSKGDDPFDDSIVQIMENKKNLWKETSVNETFDEHEGSAVSVTLNSDAKRTTDDEFLPIFKSIFFSFSIPKVNFSSAVSKCTGMNMKLLFIDTLAMAKHLHYDLQGERDEFWTSGMKEEDETEFKWMTTGNAVDRKFWYMTPSMGVNDLSQRSCLTLSYSVSGNYELTPSECTKYRRYICATF